MKRFLAVLMALCMIILVFQLSFAEPQPLNLVNVGSLKGPTSIGMVGMMKGLEDTYNFHVAGTADELVPMLAKGDLDVALIPCNLSAVLYQKLQGNVRMAAISTLGVLYVIEDGDTVQSIADLKGQTLLSTGKGTTPEYALNYVLGKNGIDPDKDLTIDYRSEATEVAAALNQGIAKLAMLPQPYVTAVLAQNSNLRVALSLTDEWAKVSPDSALVTGVVVMRKDFIANRPDAAAKFLQDYQASADWVNANPAEAALLVEDLGIATAAIAQKAIPACNIVCITGEDMKTKAQGYLQSLLDANPESVGGQLPDEGFYYVG